MNPPVPEATSINRKNARAPLSLNLLRSVLTLLSFLLLQQTFGQLPQYIPTTGLVSWFPLSNEEMLGDLAPNGNPPGTFTQSPSSIVPIEDHFGNKGGAFFFPDFHNGIEIHPKGLKMSQGFSAGGWYSTLSPDYGLEQPVIAKYINNKLVMSIGYGQGVAQCAFEGFGDSLRMIQSPKDPSVTIGWHFVAGTFDGKEMRLYVDGVYVNQLRPASAFLEKFNTNLDLPGRLIIGNTFQGSLDDVFIYNRPLTEPEIRRIYESGSPMGGLLQKSDYKVEPIDLGQGLSYYPRFTSATNPRAAAAINKCLQINDFNQIETPKNPSAFASPDWWRYSLQMPTPRMISITTIKKVIDWNRRDSPSIDIAYTYHFDAQTGDRLFWHDFISDDGARKLEPMILKQLTESMTELYSTDMTDAESKCQDYVNNSYNSYYLQLHVNPYSRKCLFDIPDCGVQGPTGADHFLFSATIPWETIMPDLSAQGKYYLDNGPATGIDKMRHTLSGVIGQNIHVTLVLYETTGHQVTGKEVYDSFGKSIDLKGTYENGVLSVDELDPKGVGVATFNAKLDGRKLTGTWTKKDGSKTLPFAAGIAGE